jgi:hypothetical protein
MEEASFVYFFNHTMTLLSEDPSYKDYDAKNKLLAFYYTFFELIRANRTYVMAVLDEKNLIKSIKALSGLKKVYITLIDSLQIETMDLKQERLEKLKERSFNEFAWKQFLATMVYWMKDTSPSFEKTDIFIEKSINASFDLVNIKPIESIIDFGKFLFKEKMSM